MNMKQPVSQMEIQGLPVLPDEASFWPEAAWTPHKATSVDSYELKLDDPELEISHYLPPAGPRKSLGP